MLGLVEYGVGGFYEFTLWLGTAPETQVQQVLSALWSLPNLDGCYLDDTRRTTDQARLSPKVLTLVDYYRLYGQATLPDGNVIACGP